MMLNEKTRGADRVFHPEGLPIYDSRSLVKYEGSISKNGDNADWDWGMFQDEKGEWVLMEADGAGCLYNFTQHRYPACKVPTFRFYFDGNEEPTLTVIPADFGACEALPAPYAGKFVGPEADGNGPIWVIRSFVPMPFRTHCKITCDFRLEGNDKALGQGGWGHAMYQLYDSPEGVTTYDGTFRPELLTEVYENWKGEALVPEVDALQPGEKRVFFAAEGAGTVRGLYASIEGFAGNDDLTDVWFSLTFDGADVPQAEAPIGTLFGCEYGETKAHFETVLLEQNIGEDAVSFRNSYPMPFGKSAVFTIENRGNRAIVCGAAARRDDTLCYDMTKAGYFTAAPYYPATPNTPGKNTVIADVRGAGSVVYAVLTGREINYAGCEGDVRVFVDGMRSPTVESDGSESWSSYGWGFVFPPQSNPFSGYNGRWYSNADWSELRLTCGDSYVFRNRLQFELEHGEVNNGGGSHSGQVFYYAAPQTPEVIVGTFTPENGLTTDGRIAPVHDRFENGIHEVYFDYTVITGATETSFTATLPADNQGMFLRRVALQKVGPQAAEVFVNGNKVTERVWLFPDSNEYYSYIEDDFMVPASYTAGKTEVTVAVRPLDANWNECSYTVAALLF